jgi:ComF family protein
MIREMTDLLMPRVCLVCGRQLGAREEHLCIWCASDLPLTYYWEQVHNPMADEFNALLERNRAEGESMAYAYATALLFYHHENPFKQIPRALKYGGNVAAGRFFAAQLGRYMAAAPQFTDIDLVIPVPLHWYRKWRRGYNQAEVIAKELARALDAKLGADVLCRIRRTRTQTRLDADARLKNVAGVFQVKSAQARRLLATARHVLLVDDTFTTGATLATCYNALRQVLDPAQRISVATLSVVQG